MGAAAKESNQGIKASKAAHWTTVVMLIQRLKRIVSMERAVTAVWSFCQSAASSCGKQNINGRL